MAAQMLPQMDSIHTNKEEIIKNQRKINELSYKLS